MRNVSGTNNIEYLLTEKQLHFREELSLERG